ncbi:hypothetical protein STRDD10_02043 [Streptococcus sp. DD10]|nr:hypothetical protein STRDD10_02043 [Streptococcus sp. DD10]
MDNFNNQQQPSNGIVMRARYILGNEFYLISNLFTKEMELIANSLSF